jgi:hypothetical protein
MDFQGNTRISTKDARGFQRTAVASVSLLVTSAASDRPSARPFPRGGDSQRHGDCATLLSSCKAFSRSALLRDSKDDGRAARKTCAKAACP